MRYRFAFTWVAIFGSLGCATVRSAHAEVPSSIIHSKKLDSLTALRSRPAEGEVIYLVIPDRFANGDPSNDRGGLSGKRSETGYDPTDKAFYHGGDLKGVTSKLDYIRGLGATAIWLTPVFRNKAVQEEDGYQSAGYHGYWPVDFTDIDPHLGTKADYKAFVDAAHARGMKVYFDLVVNHTADVIKYRECQGKACTYRSRADFPYTRKADSKGAINQGFLGDLPPYLTTSNFSKLTSPNYAYTPYVPAAERHIKKPDWLNNPIYYHNRGNSIFRGESAQLGDFMGLDDIFTENPRVVRGFIDIYSRWIDDYGIDGFRIDTARHVDAQFWQAFVPAMLARAKAKGIPNFHIFGEVMEFTPGRLARATRVDGLPAVNDFALQAALVDAIAKDGPTSKITDVFQGDALYAKGDATAAELVTLTGNHDVMRFAHAVREAKPHASFDEVMRRVRLAYAVILFSRGIPAIYYGDEQGFTGEGAIDQDSREDMFPTKVSSYQSEPRLGSEAPGNNDHFDVNHPLYKSISRMLAVRAGEPALQRGRQISRLSGDAPGLLAISRFSPSGDEVLVVFNTSLGPISGRVLVESTSQRWTPLYGKCQQQSVAPGSYAVEVPALEFIICKGSNRQ
ncbi:alpha-amylase [Rhodanobacter denitrificans]|uniref:Alpha-amylase n=2 Tax=Bacteria TaxID=2 RepID=A0A368KA96_9GAMM|nr:alpha-amylase family glycosyl hydrolase [Rhodanobacter denitrificans]RCS28859.1 alpha-amylase [Rhodanobacter denitrificans]